MVFRYPPAPASNFCCCLTICGPLIKLSNIRTTVKLFIDLLSFFVGPCQNGDTKLPSADRTAAKQVGIPGAQLNSVNGVELHAGGWYLDPNGLLRAAMEYACFGIEKPTNPCNSTVTNVVTTIVDQANKSTTDPGKIQVVVQGTGTDPSQKTVHP